jgi:hypothetical protein
LRITPEKLVDLARSEAERQAESDDIVGAYLMGSVIDGDPLIGGHADIDLVLIHRLRPTLARQILPLSAEIHLDIAHHEISLYQQPRLLRTDPWLGPALYRPRLLLDHEHFLEWAHAGVRGRYNRPDHRLRRALTFLDHARQRPVKGTGDWLAAYLRAMLDGANAVASLAGHPAAGRRVVQRLQQHLSSLDQAAIYGRFLNLLGVEALSRLDFAQWLTAWARAFDAIGPDHPDARLAPVRRDYLLSGLRTIIENAAPQMALWPLLWSWFQIHRALDGRPGAAEHVSAWQEVRQQLGLADGDRQRRLDMLEDFLDTIEEVLHEWGDKYGA